MFNSTKENNQVRKLKIPVNVSEIFIYKDLFDYVSDKGFVPEPYLSSSKFSIRAGQDNKILSFFG